MGRRDGEKEKGETNKMSLYISCRKRSPRNNIVDSEIIPFQLCTMRVSIIICAHSCVWLPLRERESLLLVHQVPRMHTAQSRQYKPSAQTTHVSHRK
jgi:hypothetical protein